MLRSFCASSSKVLLCKNFSQERYSPWSTWQCEWHWELCGCELRYLICSTAVALPVNFSWPPTPLKILARHSNEPLFPLMPSERGCKGFRRLVQSYIDVTRGQWVGAYPFGIYSWSLKGYHGPSSPQSGTMSWFPVGHSLFVSANNQSCLAVCFWGYSPRCVIISRSLQIIICRNCCQGIKRVLFSDVYS